MSPSTIPSAVTSLPFLCHLEDSIPGKEAADLVGKFGENKQSSCALHPHIGERPIGAGLGRGFAHHIYLQYSTTVTRGWTA